MKLNVAPKSNKTHEGGIAYHINAEQQLRRSVLACMLWEDSFYENGESIATRIENIIPKVSPETVRDLAIETRTQGKLRHVPLLLARAMAALPSHRSVVAQTLEGIIQRPDELSEFLAIYWRNGKQKLSAQVKKGLARAFTKFDEYSLAKYNRDGAIKLRDVLFLCHAKPKDDTQAQLFKKLIDGKLETPDTWEVQLSGGADKKATFTRLIQEKKLGALALLRNLRNMQEAQVDYAVIKEALQTMKIDRVLPFRFISAARYAPNLEPELEACMLKCLEGHEKMPGVTTLLIDVSGSMNDKISGKSDLTRIDSACALAILLREICERVEIITFSSQVVQCPPRRGFALRDAINQSQPHAATNLGLAVNVINQKIKHDRLIVITDEQTSSSVPAPIVKSAYVINVASYQNGVGYGPWTSITGWSESIVSYIVALEKSITNDKPKILS